MALRTADDDIDKLNPGHNPGDRDANKKFDDIKKAEEDGTFNDMVSPENYSKDGKSGDLSNGIREAEEDGGSWSNNTKPIAGQDKVTGKLSGLKKKSPLIAIISILIGGAGAVTLISPAILPIHILENLVQKYDSQNTTMTFRTNRLIASKISDNTTSGVCATQLNIRCRFSRPSNKLLRNLAKNHIQAVDFDGTPSKQNILFPNKAPTSYSFTSQTSGDVITVDAKAFHKTLKNNPEFRSAFHKAYNPRFTGYTDNLFKKIMAIFGLKKVSTLAGAVDDVDRNNKLNKAVAGEDLGAKDVTPDKAGSIIEDSVNKESQKQTKKLSKSAKGSLAGAIAGITCMATNIPGIVNNTARAYQMSQLIKYGMIFLTGFSAIKAGDASPGEVNSLANLLTENVNGKSAMDSFGMKYSLFGDTKSENDNYKKFSPGASTITALGGTAQLLDSKPVEDTCAVATNPVTGAAINAATAGSGVGIPVAVANFFGGMAASYIINTYAPGIIGSILKSIPAEVYNQALGLFFGDLTQNLKGEDVGNALASGASHLMGQTANAAGNVPLSVDQAIAFNQTAKEVQIAYAEEDRATLSPLDPTSPNTMIGSFFNQLLPYYSNMGTIGGVVSSLGSLVTGSLQSTIKPLTAHAIANTGVEYQLCSDPALNDVAAGPFCNVQYGIPPQYLDMDPLTIIDNLIASGDIDPNTGEVIEKPTLDTFDLSLDSENVGSLKDWLDLCTDGTTNQAKACIINDENIKNNSKIIEYALYSIDHRIQRTMDGEEDQTTDTPDSTAINTSKHSLSLNNNFMIIDNYALPIRKTWSRAI